MRLLGRFSLASGDAELAGALTARLQALLAWLLLHRDAPQARQQLAFRFWPDTTEAQAHTNLRQSLHALRRRLPGIDVYLAVTDKTVRWRGDAPFTLDVAEFEAALAEAGRSEGGARLDALERAVAVYRGDLLPGCYDDWLLAERARLAQSHLDALEQLTLLLEQRRDYGRAIEQAMRLLRHDPLHEAAYRCLMRLHAINGDRPAALRVYHTCVTALERELGVPPGAETVAAYQRLLDLEHGPARAPLPSGARRFIGRQAEWQRLQECWRDVQHGGVHCICLSGEAGIGKTRLAEEWLAWAGQQGIATAATRAYAGGGSLAYAPLVELLRGETLRPAVGRLAPVWRSELARLLPELLADDPKLPQPEPLTGHGQVQHLYDAIQRVLLQPDRPLILLLDDLQWFDAETLAWLRYLLRPADGRTAPSSNAPRLLVLAALRREEIDEGQTVARLLLDLQQHERLSELALAPLTADETAELVGRAADRPLDALTTAAIHRAAEGNPLFIIEAVRAGLTAAAGAEAAPALLGAPKVQAVIRSRLMQLSPAARELAGLAAAIGRAFAYDLLARASGRDEETVAHCLDELWRRRIIREQGVQSYDFSHDRIRDVAYGDLSPALRLHCHRRVAEALETSHGDALDAISDELAVHCERADLPAKAISYHQRAAAAARRAFANEGAIDHLSRALLLLRALPETADRNRQELALQIELSAALQAARSTTAPEVEAAYRRAEELARLVGEPPELFPARFGWWVFQFGVSAQQALEIGHELLASAMKWQDQVFILQAHHALWTSSFVTGDFPAALAHSEQGQAIYRPETHHAQLYVYGGHDVGLCGLSFAGLTRWSLGYPDQALNMIQRGLDLSQQFTHPAALVQPLYYAAILHQLRRDAPATQRQAEAARDLRRRHRIMTAWPGWDACLLGWAEGMQGRAAAGIEQIAQGLSESQKSGSRLQNTYFMTLLAEVYGRAGELAAGLQTLDAALALAEQTGERWWTAEMHRLRGDLLLEQGDERAAEDAYLQAIEIARQQQARSLELRATVALCRLWQRQDKRAQAYRGLSAIYGWFTEGFDTFDLRAARELLEQLA